MAMEFLFLLDYGTEVVFDVDGNQFLYDIKGINFLSDLHARDSEICLELEQARIALLDYQQRPIKDSLPYVYEAPATAL